MHWLVGENYCNSISISSTIDHPRNTLHFMDPANETIHIGMDIQHLTINSHSKAIYDLYVNQIQYYLKPPSNPNLA